MKKEGVRLNDIWILDLPRSFLLTNKPCYPEPGSDPQEDAAEQVSIEEIA